MKVDIRDLLAVYMAPVERVRFGPEGDGGYVLAGAIIYDRFVSCGIGDNIGFEIDILNQYPNLHCQAIDGTISCLPEEHERLVLCRLMVGSPARRESNLEWELEGASNALVKMDIEGSEHRWSHHASARVLKSIAQLVIEVHYLHEKDNWKILERLRDTHNLIHVHGNNYGGMTDQGVPNVIELTYLRKDFFDGFPRYYHYQVPMGLDFPNNPQKPDLVFRL